MAEPSAPGRSFDQEALPHLDTLYRVALRLTADPTLAEDLVQDTMLKAYRPGASTTGTNARGWLLTIAKHLHMIRRGSMSLWPWPRGRRAACLVSLVQETDPRAPSFPDRGRQGFEAIDSPPDRIRECWL